VSSSGAGRHPDLIVGHGTLGRLIARLAVAAGAAPVVWEIEPSRRDGTFGYPVIDPAEDPRRDYACVCDASGDATHLDALIGRLAPGGEVVLAGFYHTPLSFDFAPAFMREARLRVAAQWRPHDLEAVIGLNRSKQLPLADLISHRADARDAPRAYDIAFSDPTCLKMVLDWSSCR
jgi:bacteriochlorophyllide a dehydrogenase